MQDACWLVLLGQPIFPGDSGVDQLVEIIKVLGTPTRDQIKEMNPNYTEFKFPQIKSHPWQKVSKRQAMVFNNLRTQSKRYFTPLQKKKEKETKKERNLSQSISAFRPISVNA